MGKLRLQWLIGEAIVQMSGKVKSKTLFCFWPIDDLTILSYHPPSMVILRSFLLNASIEWPFYDRPEVLATLIAY